MHVSFFCHYLKQGTDLCLSVFMSFWPTGIELVASQFTARADAPEFCSYYRNKCQQDVGEVRLIIRSHYFCGIPCQEYINILILLTYINIYNSCIIVTNNYDNNKLLLIDSSQNGYSEVPIGTLKSQLMDRKVVVSVQCGEKCVFCLLLPGKSVSLEARFHRCNWMCLSMLVGWVRQFGSGSSYAFS